MEKNNMDTEFRYTYSAKEQDEIKRIRQKYQSQEENTMGRLRKLDESVTKKATTVALLFGIAGALLLGTGMSLIMTDIAAMLGMSGMTYMVAGLLTGIVGIAFMILAYPVYSKILVCERKKIAPEIMRLTDELMK